MRPVYLLLAFVVMLIALGVLFPNNAITGNVVKDETCGDLGCVKLCDQDSPTGDVQSAASSATGSCDRGEVCCPTHWASGVCEQGMNCAKIREYSLYQTLETYQDSVREQPAPVRADFRQFFLPIIIIIGIVALIIWRYRNPTRNA